jgi:DNA-binding transcriptional MerR regulator
VSELCGVKPHVLRYWEQEFTQLRPVKRRGNRRYYQHHEVLLVRRIRELLYQEGFTISGARNRLEDGPVKMSDARRTADAGTTVRRMARRYRCAPNLRRSSKLLRSCLIAAQHGANRLPQSDRWRFLCYNSRSRGVAQPGSALAWGARGREFESRRPDQ